MQQDARVTGIYRLQNWTIADRIVYAKVDNKEPYYVYNASMGGWGMTASLEDFENDAGFYHTDFGPYLPQSCSKHPVHCDKWLWGDGAKWQEAKDMRVVPWGCPHGAQGLHRPPIRMPSPNGKKLQKQYTAVFEESQAEEGLLDKDGEQGEVIGKMRWKVLSKSKPRLIYISNFSSEEDCEAILTHARKKLERSSVVAAAPSDSISDVRTSFGMFLNAPQMAEPSIGAMRRRVATIAQLPIENVEATQVLRYEPGQFYGPHPDFFDPHSEHLMRGGQRVATLISWLNDVPGGGYTKFPRQPGLEVEPKKGDAILFYNCHPDGTIDPYSEHQGLPPTGKAVKWVQVHWVRQNRFN